MKKQTLSLLALLLIVTQGCIDDRRSAADDDTADQSITADGSGDAAIPPPPPRPDGGDRDAESGPMGCETADDCPAGSECDDGQCTEPECTGDDQCTAFVQSCIDGACRDRCLGSRCIRGGVCIDGFCLPPECEADSDCPEGRRCRAGICEEWTACAADEDCGPDDRCVEGACEPLPECVGDRGCDPGTICSEGRCRPQPGCDNQTPCDDGLDCVGGRCVPFVCRADRDCDGEQLCRAGLCVEPDSPEVAAVIILNPPQTLPPGAPLEFRAVGLSLRGDIVVSEDFDWSTDTPAVLVVDSEDELGSISINAADGSSAQLTASYTNPDNSVITSQPVQYRVAAPADRQGLTLSVVDSETGRPVGGATIDVGGDRQVTDETGVVTFPDAIGSPNISAFAAEYDYLTLVGVEIDEGGAHLLLPINPRTTIDRVAGFTGTVDYDRVSTQGGVELGLTGPSFASGLTQVTFDNLLGSTFNREINAGPVNVDLPLPGGLTLAADIPFVGQIDAKTTYYVSAEPGLRLGWSFGGRIDIQAVIGLAMGGEGDGIGRVLGVLLPYFETFDHGLRVGERLVALPRIVDEDDIDGDEDIMERVPDYERFPVLNIGPDQQQRLRLQIDAASAMSEGETAIFFPGVQFEGIGFVPLGVTAATEPGDIPARMAAPYGGLEGGTPTVLAISTEFGDATELPRDLTLRIQRYGLGVPRDVTFTGGPLARPNALDYNAVLRDFGGAGSEGAHFHRASFNGPEGRWEVFFAPDAPTELSLPVPPDGLGDLAAASDVRLEAIILDTEGVNMGLTFRSLVDLAGTGDLSLVDEKAVTVARTSL